MFDDCFDVCDLSDYRYLPKAADIGLVTLLQNTTPHSCTPHFVDLKFAKFLERTGNSRVFRISI
jgi:hypothetical protein